VTNIANDIRMTMLSKLRTMIRSLTPGVAFLAGLLIVLVMTAGSATAQVVVLVNGAPVTALDIAHRTKLLQLTTNHTPTRQQALDSLIDDHLKISIGKRYGIEASDAEVDQAFANMAPRGHMTTEQMGKQLGERGIGVNAFRFKLRADIVWSQIIRGKFQSSLQIGDSELDKALGHNEKDDVGYVYTLYPIVVVVPQGSSESLVATRRREADNLRGRFNNCAQGLKLARALRDVAVREPITRSSADVSAQLRELLAKMEVGKLTAPEASPQGLQMFALCGKKQIGTDSVAKRELRDQMYSKRFDAEGQKYLKELRSQAMIEYR
jgi:peptidyl-prolyl cis-trans isomerase SurA